MATLTQEQLKAICPTLTDLRAIDIVRTIHPALTEFQIETPLRIAAFVAQLAHETGEFKFMRELWGPTAQQKKYDPPTALAKKLGNTEAGDGYLYRGRGPIQLTGKANYKAASDALSVDLVAQPELAANLEIGFRVAGWFWRGRGLNELADDGQYREITKKINGGYTAMTQRIKYYDRAKAQLGAATTQEAA
jgi:predicted chitinase